MLLTKQSKQPKFTAGDTVKIASRETIARLIDPITKALDGCLFMDQMGDYCGNKYQVLRVVDSLFNEHQHRTFKPKSPMYLLEYLTCNGKMSEFSDKCNHRCFILWHEQWLEEPNKDNAQPGGYQENVSNTALGSTKCQLQLIDEIGEKNNWFNEKLQFSIRKFRFYQRKFISVPHIHGIMFILIFKLQTVKLTRVIW